ncbi:MAG TPA: nitroreductase family protein [Methanobacteriaceae archaeon]|nr:nitroreductase family protein [Methanobacteriaceae archaeon]
MNSVLESIKNRRSIRKYLPDQIKDEELAVILEAAQYAPSARNDQPWYFTVIQDRVLIEYMNKEAKRSMKESGEEWLFNIGNSERYHVFHHAPTVIVVSGEIGATEPMVDCSAATQNILLAAESLGIGSCWIGLARFFFTDKNFGEKYVAIPERVEELGIPFGYQPFFAITLGYKDQDVRAPPRKQNLINYIK